MRARPWSSRSSRPSMRRGSKSPIRTRWPWPRPRRPNAQSDKVDTTARAAPFSVKLRGKTRTRARCALEVVTYAEGNDRIGAEIVEIALQVPALDLELGLEGRIAGEDAVIGHGDAGLALEVGPGLQREIDRARAPAAADPEI